jgi:AraC family transcriptional regulator, regulatory protein of adaptative response / methylated-DNA-[protein]-cysteine methyltransferase
MTDLSPDYHFNVIARAIHEIDSAGPGLTLESLADRMGMSAAHFQRLFSAWVGVSPKRYQQYLALDHAKSLLATRHTVLDAADSAGLSGSGRLHDLFLTWEAMTPGEFARAGEGLDIRYGWFDSPFGPAIAMGTDRGLCGMGFAAEMGRETAFADLTRRWPKARFMPDAEPLRAWVLHALGARTGQNTDVPLYLIGAPFQIKVWEALLRVPSGHVTTYSDIATVIGHPKAVRAVGSAIGRNPISMLIPCHRALRKSGALGGYHWGLNVKRAILAREAAQADTAM